MVVSRVFAFVLCVSVFGALRASAAPHDPVSEHEPEPQPPTAAGQAVYAYTDDAGRLVIAQRYSDIPMHLRDVAKRVDVPDAAAADSDTKPWEQWLSTTVSAAQPVEPVLYRYRSAGRTVYTNLEGTVPNDQRNTARIDLRNVPLNSTLGKELDQQFKDRYEKLKESSACSQLQAAAREPWWSLTYLKRPEHQPLWLCGGALLLIVLCTPWMLSKGWGSAWARVLKTAGPLLGFVGFSAFTLMKMNRSADELQLRASRCEAGSYTAANGLPQKFQLVQALEAEHKAIAQIAAESR
ncbi:MAG: hypothetical protein RL701_5932 [Pseudomonadota bacterium]|jgi:hypothetical protein